MRPSYYLKWFCGTLLQCGHLLFTLKTQYVLKFHFGQIDRSEICTEISFTLPELIWKLIIQLAYTEVKLYPKLKSQTGLSSLYSHSKFMDVLCYKHNIIINDFGNESINFL